MRYAILSLCLILASALPAFTQEPPAAKTITITSPTPLVQPTPVIVSGWQGQTIRMVEPTASRPTYVFINGRLYQVQQPIYTQSVIPQCVGGNCPKR